MNYEVQFAGEPWKEYLFCITVPGKNERETTARNINSNWCVPCHIPGQAVEHLPSHERAAAACECCHFPPSSLLKLADKAAFHAK